MTSHVVQMAPPPNARHLFAAHALSHPVPTTRAVPLCDQPNFRVDALRRAVFVFGLQTAEEFRAALDLLHQQCGEIAGAFRAADHALRPDCRVATAGCVVLCIIFSTVASASAAQELDGAVEVYQRRLVITLATRYRKTCGEERTRDALPLQHEKLWQMLFTEAVPIDWAAASAAAGRGEALRIYSTTFCAPAVEGTQQTKSRTSTGTTGEEGRVSMHTHTHVGMDSHTFPSGMSGTGSGSDSGGVGGSGVEGGHSVEYVLPYDRIHTETSTTAFSHTRDDLGRSNTLQQQYYNNKYNGLISPVGGSHTSWWSTLKRMAFGTSHDPHHYSAKGIETGSIAPPPMRRRVEVRGGHSIAFPHTHPSATSCPTAPVSASRIAPSLSSTAAGVKHIHAIHQNDRENFSHKEDVAESVYIPRMRGAGTYAFAALPFASALLAPFCHVATGRTWSTAHEPPTNHVEQTQQKNQRHKDRSEEREDVIQATHGPSHVKRKRQREKDLDSHCKMGDGFVSLTPDVLSTTFTVPAPVNAHHSPQEGIEPIRREGTVSLGRPTAAMGTSISAAASNDAVRQFMTKHVRLRPARSAQDGQSSTVTAEKHTTDTGGSQGQSKPKESRTSVVKSLLKAIWN